MTPTVHDFSVIICAYTEERWDDLVAAVESVQQQTLPPREIIAVIDHNPQLLKRAQEHIPGVIVVENTEVKGLSGARNSGGAVGQGEVLAFLDDDAIAQPDWIENLAACYTDPYVVGVGGKIDPLWEVSRPSWFPDEFNWVVGCTYRGMPTENARVRNMIGANMSMRRDILATVDGFRESFGCDKDTSTTQGALRWFHHYAGDEETEFCIRVTQQLPGSVWLYTASAVVQHRVSVQRTRWSYFLWRCYDEGLGKAHLVRLHNREAALSSERVHTLKVLPRGVARGLADTFLRFDLTGMLRAGAIVVGLAITVVGYLVGSISSRIAVCGNVGLTPVDCHRAMEVPHPSMFRNRER